MEPPWNLLGALTEAYKSSRSLLGASLEPLWSFEPPQASSHLVAASVEPSSSLLGALQGFLEPPGRLHGASEEPPQLGTTSCILEFLSSFRERSLELLGALRLICLCGVPLEPPWRLMKPYGASLELPCSFRRPH